MSFTTTNNFHPIASQRLFVVSYITECIHHQHVQHKKTWLGSRGRRGSGGRGGSRGRQRTAPVIDI